MKLCSLCWYWSPSQWDEWRWVDEDAMCRFKNVLMNRDKHCDNYTFSEPKAEVPKRNKSKVIISEGNKAVGKLYAHQIEAFERYKDEKAIALFFTMGVGKSATALVIASHKYKTGQIDALLVIAPNGVHRQWAFEQIPQWLDVPHELQCFGGRGGNKDTYIFTDDSVLQIVCVNIDTFSAPTKWKDVVEWANAKRTFIVLDEATCCKNVKAIRTERLLYSFNDVVKRGKTIVKSTPKSAARAVLTGTPVTNSILDVWPMMEFLQPNYFRRNYFSFQTYYGMFTNIEVNGRTIKVPLNEDKWEAIKRCRSFGDAYHVFGCTEDTYNTIQSQAEYEGPYKHADELKLALEPVAMYRSLEECVDMPAQSRISKKIFMSDMQRRVYDEMADMFIAEYKHITATALNKITAMIRLQQISSGFVSQKVFDPDSDVDFSTIEVEWIGESNPKLEALYQDVEEASKPLIIITRFSCEADRIFEELKDKYKCCLMTGWKKVGTIEDFQIGKYEIMVANIRVVSRGFNLQNSHVMLFYSNTFSLEDRLQVEGRIFRIGQKEVCEYVDYSNDDSIDEKVISALLQKKKLLDYIRTADIQELV